MDRSLIIFLISSALGAAATFLFLRWSRGRTLSPAEIEQLAAEHTRRISAPQFAALVAHLDRPLPASYTELFGRPDQLPPTPFVLSRPGTEDSWYITMWFPADRRSLEDASWVLGKSHLRLPLANSDGDVLYLFLDEATGDDAPVFVSYHDGGDQERLSSSLRALLKWPRLRVPPVA